MPLDQNAWRESEAVGDVKYAMAARTPTFASLTLDDLDSLSLDGLFTLPLGIGHLGDNSMTFMKIFGKFIAADQLARAQVLALQKLVVGSMNQLQAADPNFYDDLVSSLVPFSGDMKIAVNAATAVRGYAKRGCLNLLTKAIAVDLGLPVDSDVAVVGPAFSDALAELGMSVAPAGDNPNGFASYFANELGINLPTSSSPNIPDSWIDDDLV